MKDRFHFKKFPRRLNVGCGYDKKAGYLNVDFQAFHGPDLVADITDLSMLPDGHYEELVAQDVLEHIGRTETLRVLVEWNRLLAKGGILHLRVPDVLGVADLLRAPERQTPAQQQELVQCLFGSQRYSGDFHFTAFTETLLRHYLENSGFRVVSIVARDGWLLNAVAQKTGAPDLDDVFAIRDDAEFLERLYWKVLGRAPDTGGLANLLGRLRAAEITRSGIVEMLAASPEAKALKEAGGGQ